MTRKKYVFLCYYRDKAEEVAKLRDDLIVVRDERHPFPAVRPVR